MVRANPSGGGGGGGGPFFPGPLLSGVGGNNNDTYGPQAPSVGAMIIGDSAPLWNVMTIGTTGMVLVAAGTPGWAFLTGANFAAVAANFVLAGPTSGGSAVPTFRALVAADIPSGFANTALSNLASVAVNASLTPGADNSLVLGTATIRWQGMAYSSKLEGYGASADANPQTRLGLGSLLYGAGGASALDVGITRSSAGVLAFTDASTGTGVLKKLSKSVAVLTDAATVVIDATLANIFTLTLTANNKLGNPSGAKDGDVLEIIIQQGGAGSFIPTYDTKYRFGTTLPSSSVVYSTAVGTSDRLLLEYDGADDKFDVIGFVAGFA